MRRSNSLVGLILIAIAILVIAIPGWAAEKATVGLIDINKILDAHPNTQKILDAEKTTGRNGKKTNRVE